MCIAKRSFHQHTPFPYRGTGQCYISSGYKIWRETAERKFGFITMQ